MHTETQSIEPRLTPDLQNYFRGMQAIQRNQELSWNHRQIQEMLDHGIPLEMIVEAMDEYRLAIMGNYGANMSEPRNQTRGSQLTRREILSLLGIGAVTTAIGLCAFMKKTDCEVEVRHPTRAIVYEEHRILRELLENRNLCEVTQRATVEIWTGKKRGIAYIADSSTLVSSAHLFQDEDGAYDATIKFITGVDTVNHGSIKTKTIWEPDTANYASAYDSARDIIVIRFGTNIFPENAQLPLATNAEITGIALKSNIEWHINGGILTRIDENGGTIYMHAETTPGSSGGVVVTHEGHFIGIAVSDEKNPKGVSTTKIARITPATIRKLGDIAISRL